MKNLFTEIKQPTVTDNVARRYMGLGLRKWPETGLILRLEMDVVSMLWQMNITNDVVTLGVNIHETLKWGVRDD